MWTEVEINKTGRNVNDPVSFYELFTFDAPREFDFINVSYKERDKYYFNQRSVDELDLSLHPIDGLSIAMGAFESIG